MMDKREVQHAMNTGFSELEFTPRHKQAVFATVKGERVVKRKMSFGFVLVLVLIIVAMVAVAAALLSNKDFTSEILAPIAQETDSNRWTREELDEILRFAQENGVVLTDDVMERLSKAEGEYKEELMRAFLKAELGFYPATWSIEDQAWYDALLVESGLNDVQTRFVPEGDEISMEQALSITQTYVKDELGDDIVLSDESTYLRFVEYRQFIDQDGTVHPRKWYISYESQDSYHDDYHFTILANGIVEESTRESEQSNWRDEWYDTLMSDAFWTIEGLYNFQQEWAPKVEALKAHGEHFDSESTIMYFLKKEFGLPSVTDISRDEAVNIANRAILSTLGWTEEKLSYFTTHETYRVENPEQPLYWFIYVWNVESDEDAEKLRAMNNTGDLPMRMVVKISAITGELVELNEHNTSEPLLHYGIE